MLMKKKKKKTFETLNHDHKVLGLDHDFSLAQQIHRSHIRGNQDWTHYLKSQPKKKRMKLRNSYGLYRFNTSI